MFTKRKSSSLKMIKLLSAAIHSMSENKFKKDLCMRVHKPPKGLPLRTLRDCLSSRGEEQKI